MNKVGVFLGIAIFLLASCGNNQNVDDSTAVEHPCLILTKESVSDIKKGISDLPLLASSFQEIQSSADASIEKGVIVPVPKDAGGGYTHEQHKRNYTAMYNAGICYQITGDEKYRNFIKEMLLEYADLYPTLGFHPIKRSKSPGKLFWQGLNESVWLVYTIQAYDCIYETLSDEDRENINDNLFRNVVHFLVYENARSFNRVHNKGTWAAAGVGMTGMVLNDTNYIKMAIYGSDFSGKSGFLRQIDELFSPDGFYAEGPYYQRYVILPFLVFAQAIDNNYKQADIFNYKNGVLNKAVSTLLELTNTSGRLLPLNDVVKDKDYLSPELMYGTNIVYSHTGDKGLLSIAEKQNRVMISPEGLQVAKALDKGLQEDLKRPSLFISDGKNGDLGGIAMLQGKFDNNQFSLVLKATSQGMGHGHFDRLSFLMNENGNEIIQDYGSARFLNVEQKHGGGYLRENKSWAKQTIAHNTVTINERSNYNGKTKVASKFNPNLIYFDLENPEIKIVAAADSHSYKGAVLQRTMALVSYNGSPVVIDVFRVLNSTKSKYDLPIYYKGQTIATNFKYNASTEIRTVLGEKHGYEHLWVLAHTDSLKGKSSLTWLNNHRFYTYSFVTDKNSEVFLTQIGANDPEFNLRNEPGILLRQNNADNHTFFSVIEAHGGADPVRETVWNTKSNVKDLRIIYQDNEVTGVSIKYLDGENAQFFVSHSNTPEYEHVVNIDGKTVTWKGNYSYKVSAE